MKGGVSTLYRLDGKTSRSFSYVNPLMKGTDVPRLFLCMVLIGGLTSSLMAEDQFSFDFNELPETGTPKAKVNAMLGSGGVYGKSLLDISPFGPAKCVRVVANFDPNAEGYGFVVTTGDSPVEVYDLGSGDEISIAIRQKTGFVVPSLLSVTVEGRINGKPVTLISHPVDGRVAIPQGTEFERIAVKVLDLVYQDPVKTTGKGTPDETHTYRQVTPDELNGDSTSFTNVTVVIHKPKAAPELPEEGQARPMIGNVTIDFDDFRAGPSAVAEVAEPSS